MFGLDQLGLGVEGERGDAGRVRPAHVRRGLGGVREDYASGGRNNT